MRKYKVWCKNKNEWEKHGCLLLPNGHLIQKVGDYQYIPCKPETHIIVWFTGLFDKNGEEIYEGDIIKWKHEYLDNEEDELRITDIIFRNGAFALRERYWDDGVNEWHSIEQFAYFPNKPEIIGNIFENPELLRGK